LERILAHQATPKPSWQQLGESEQETLNNLAQSEPIGPRHSQEYQDLLYGTQSSTGEHHEATEKLKPDDNSENTSDSESIGTSENASDSGNSLDAPSVDPEPPGDVEDPHDRGGA